MNIKIPSFKLQSIFHFKTIEGRSLFISINLYIPYYNFCVSLNFRLSLSLCSLFMSIVIFYVALDSRISGSRILEGFVPIPPCAVINAPLSLLPILDRLLKMISSILKSLFILASMSESYEMVESCRSCAFELYELHFITSEPVGMYELSTALP